MIPLTVWENVCNRSCDVHCEWLLSSSFWLYFSYYFFLIPLFSILLCLTHFSSHWEIHSFSVFLNGYDPKWMNNTIKFLHVPNLFSSSFLPPSDTNYVSYLLPPSPYITFLALKLFLFLPLQLTILLLCLINHWNRLWKMFLFTTKETEHYFFLLPLLLFRFIWRKESGSIIIKSVSQ